MPTVRSAVEGVNATSPVELLTAPARLTSLATIEMSPPAVVTLPFVVVVNVPFAPLSVSASMAIVPVPAALTELLAAMPVSARSAMLPFPPDAATSALKVRLSVAFS